MQKLVLLLALSFAAMTTACSKDHDLDDYKQEQFQKYYAKVANVGGRYTGALRSASNGSVLSSLSITLRPTAQAVTSGDSASDSVKPSLSAEIEFGNTAVSAKVTVQNGQYIDQQHLFHATFTTVATSGAAVPPEIIEITGTIGDDGSFTGTMAAPGYEDEGGKFALQKNGPQLKAVAKSLNLGSTSVFATTDESSSFKYEGTYTDSQGTIPAELIVSTPARTRLDEIADLLNPSREKFYALNFKENGNASVDFQAAEYDAGQQRLKGTQTKALQGGSTNAVFNIVCDDFRLTNATYNFTCTYTSNLLSREAKLEFHSP